jgi:AbrB family looped-hinge helix DNA binding protein
MGVVVTVTDKGQLTVPKALRDRLDIRPGTKVDFDLMPDGSVRMTVLARGAGNLFGLLHRRGRKSRSIEEMDAGIVKATANRAKRSKA